MSQTLMAILAMMTVTLVSIHQQRTLLETQRAMLDDELEVMASGIALQAIEYIATKGFDPATLAGTVREADELTASFPAEKRCTLLASREGTGGYEACDTLNDYNEMVWEDVPFVIGGDTITFEVTADVGYLDESQQRISDPTFSKEVVVTVREKTREGVRRLMRHPVHVARTFSY